jgi:hypothetical protein
MPSPFLMPSRLMGRFPANASTSRTVRGQSQWSVAFMLCAMVEVSRFTIEDKTTRTTHTTLWINRPSQHLFQPTSQPAINARMHIHQRAHTRKRQNTHIRHKKDAHIRKHPNTHVAKTYKSIKNTRKNRHTKNRQNAHKTCT